VRHLLAHALERGDLLGLLGQGGVDGGGLDASGGRGGQGLGWGCGAGGRVDGGAFEGVYQVGDVFLTAEADLAITRGGVSGRGLGGRVVEGGDVPTTRAGE
jgi:hypothetical protein